MSRLDHVVGGLGAGLVHAARLEHLAVGQRVGDVAGERELLDPRGQRRVRRRLEGLLGGTADVGGLLGVGQVEVDLGVALLAAAAYLPALEALPVEDGRVVRRVAELGVDLVGGAARAGAAGRGGGLLLLERQVPAHQALAELVQARGHLVDGRRGHDEHAEDGQEHEQRHHDVRRAEQVGEQLGDHEADRPAGLLQGAGVAQPRGRRAVGDVHEAQDAEEEGGPADDLAAGRAVVVGVAQVAPGHEAQQERHEPGDEADRAGDDGTHGVGESAGQLPPDAGGDDDGESDQHQAGPVATVLGLELAGGVPDPAYGGPDGVRHPEPGGHHDPGQRAEDAEDGSGAAADGARGRPLRGGAGRGLARGRLAP